MIYLSIQGGIGNQLFEYAMARNISLKTGQKIVLECYSINRDKQRTLKLSRFNIPEENLGCITSLKGKFYNAQFNSFLKVILKFKIKFILERLYKKNILVYTDSSYRKFKILNDKDVHLYGYFQSEKFFQDSKDIIKKELRIQPNKSNETLIKKIMRNSDSVCLHYRKGDYQLKKNSMYQVCDTNYYLNAILLMKKKIKKPVFYVFSDNIEEVKKEFSSVDANLEYISNVGDDIDELSVMIACNHFIISNSSFSWWAQYLSESKDKIVLAPAKWTASNENQDIYMDSWERVS